MTLEGAQFICLDEAGNRGEIVAPKGRKFTVGYYVNCDFVITEDDNRTEGIHCTIECDAFGRVSVRNLSTEHPIRVNGAIVDNKRTLFNNSIISILDKRYLWLSSAHSDAADKDDVPSTDVSTPTKLIGIPQHSGFSSPGIKSKKGESRFTVHNFAYCIQSDEDGNTSVDSNSKDESSSNLAEEEKQEVAQENSSTDITPLPIHKEREVTPEPASTNISTPSTADALEGTPKMNLINCTNNKENTGSTKKKNRLQLSMCHQSDVVITSFSPRQTGAKTEKSFTAILLPKVLVTRAPNTPQSVYSTPKSVLGDDGDDDDNFEKSQDSRFHTPSTSKKVRGVMMSSAPRSLKNSSMHLVDYTSPMKMTPASPYLKSALKASAKKNHLTPSADKVSKNTKLSDKQLGVCALPCTPVISETAMGSETPGSAISVNSSDSSSVIEILSDASTPGISNVKTPQKTQTAKTQSTPTTPMRTPQSLMKRAMVGNNNKQLTTPQRGIENAQTTPRREPINRIPLRTSISALRSPVTPRAAGSEVNTSKRESLSLSSRKSLSAAALRFDNNSSTNTKFATPSSTRRSLMPKSACKAPTTSTPLCSTSSYNRYSGCNTTPLNKVRKSFGGVPLSSHISKARKSIIAAAPSNYTSIKEKSPQQQMSDKLLYRARKSVGVTPMVARAISMVQAAKESPSSILRHRKPQRKSIATVTPSRSVLFADKQVKLQTVDRSLTFILDTDSEDSNDAKGKKSENEARSSKLIPIEAEEIINLTFSPEKKGDKQPPQEEVVCILDETPVDVDEVPQNEEKNENDVVTEITKPQENTRLFTEMSKEDESDNVVVVPTTSQTTEDSFAEEILNLQKEELDRKTNEMDGEISAIDVTATNSLAEQMETGFGEEPEVYTANVEEVPEPQPVLEKSSCHTYKPIYEDITVEDSVIEKDINEQSISESSKNVIMPTCLVTEQETGKVVQEVPSPSVQSAENDKEQECTTGSSERVEFVPAAEKTHAPSAEDLEEVNTCKLLEEIDDVLNKSDEMNQKHTTEEEEKECAAASTAPIRNEEHNTPSVSEKNTIEIESNVESGIMAPKTVPYDRQSDNIETIPYSTHNEMSKETDDVIEANAEVCAVPIVESNPTEAEINEEAKDEEAAPSIQEHINPAEETDKQLVQSKDNQQAATDSDGDVKDSSSNMELSIRSDAVSNQAEVKSIDAAANQAEAESTDDAFDGKVENDETITESTENVNKQLEENEDVEIDTSKNAKDAESSSANENISPEDASEAKEFEISSTNMDSNQDVETQESISLCQSSGKANEELEENKDDQAALEQEVGGDMENLTPHDELNLKDTSEDTQPDKDSEEVIRDLEQESGQDMENLTPHDELNHKDTSETTEMQDTQPDNDSEEVIRDLEQEGGEVMENLTPHDELNHKDNSETTEMQDSQPDNDSEEAIRDTNDVTEYIETGKTEDIQEVKHTDSENEQELLQSAESSQENVCLESNSDCAESVDHSTQCHVVTEETEAITSKEEDSESKETDELQAPSSKNEIIQSEHKLIAGNDNIQEVNLECVISQSDNKMAENKEDVPAIKSESEDDIMDKKITENVQTLPETSEHEKHCSENASQIVQTDKTKVVQSQKDSVGESKTPGRTTRRKSLSAQLEPDVPGTPAKIVIEIEKDSSTLTPRRSTRRKSATAEPCSTLLQTPRRTTRRASMSAEITTVVTPTTAPTTKSRRASLSSVKETPLTPRRITRRRSSMSLETNEAVQLLEETKASNDAPISGTVLDGIKEDMGAIIEEEDDESTRMTENILMNVAERDDEMGEILSEGNIGEIIYSEEMKKAEESTQAVTEPNEEQRPTVVTNALQFTEDDEENMAEVVDVSVQDLPENRDTESSKEDGPPLLQEIHDLTIPSEEDVGEVVNVYIQDLNVNESKCPDDQTSVKDLTESISEEIRSDQKRSSDGDKVQSSDADDAPLNVTGDEDMETLEVSDEDEIEYAYGREIQAPFTPKRTKRDRPNIRATKTPQKSVLEHEGTQNLQSVQSIMETAVGTSSTDKTKNSEKLSLDDVEITLKSCDTPENEGMHEHIQTTNVITTPNLGGIKGHLEEEELLEDNKQREDKEILNSPKLSKTEEDVLNKESNDEPQQESNVTGYVEEIAGSNDTLETSIAVAENEDGSEVETAEKATEERMQSPDISKQLQETGNDNKTDKTQELHGVKELLKTPTTSSTPRFKGMRELMQTPKVSSTPVLGGLKELLDTPKPSEGGEETDDHEDSQEAGKYSIEETEATTQKHLTRDKVLLKTPKTCTTPQFRGMRELMQTPKVSSTPVLRGVKELLDTPKQSESGEETSDHKESQEAGKHLIEATKATQKHLTGDKVLLKTPKTCTTPQFRGMRELMQTPKVSSTPVLGGVKELLDTPKQSESGEETSDHKESQEAGKHLIETTEAPQKHLTGVKELLKTPKTCTTPRFKGMRELMQTPKVSSTPVFGGVKELLDTPKPSESGEETSDHKESQEAGKHLIETTEAPQKHLTGVKELLKTPKTCTTPRFKGMRELMQTPKVSSTPVFGGVKELLDTPKPSESGEETSDHKESQEAGKHLIEATNATQKHLTGDKVLLKTPKTCTTPQFRGMRELMQTPKVSSTPVLGGVKELLDTPKQSESGEETSDHKESQEAGKHLIKTTEAPQKHLTGVKELLKTPKTCTTPRFKGMRELMQTPKVSSTPVLGGVKELLDTPKQSEGGEEKDHHEESQDAEKFPIEPTDATQKHLTGVKELLKTPKTCTTPRFKGMRELMQTPKVSSTPVLGGVKELLDTPKQSEGGEEKDDHEESQDAEKCPIEPTDATQKHLTGDKELLKTPKTCTTPQFRGMRELMQTPTVSSTSVFGGVKELLDTPKPSEGGEETDDHEKTQDAEKCPIEPTDATQKHLTGDKALLKTPKTCTTPQFRGMRELMQTPTVSSTSVFGGVKELLDTPKPSEGGEETDDHEKTQDAEKCPIEPTDATQKHLTGDTELLKTPKTCTTPQVRGMRELMQTPKVSSTPILGGVKELLDTPNQSEGGEETDDHEESQNAEKFPIEPTVATQKHLTGVKELLKTPKTCTTPRFKGMRELMQTPKISSTPVLGGVKELLDTPKQSESGEETSDHKESQEAGKHLIEAKNATQKHLTGDKVLLKTPKTCTTPQFRGMRELMQTPKVSSTPVLGGVKELLDTPKQSESGEETSDHKESQEAGKHLIEATDATQKHLTGDKELLKTPKICTTPQFRGMQELMQTPKVSSTPVFGGVKELLDTPKPSEGGEETDDHEKTQDAEKCPIEPTTQKHLTGVKALLKTPKDCTTPRFKGMRELMQTPKVTSTPLLEGVKALLDTPKQSEDIGGAEKESEHEAIRKDLADVSGNANETIYTPKQFEETVEMECERKDEDETDYQKILKTPKSCATPQLKGMLEHTQTPKTSASPVLGSAKELIAAPDLTKTVEQKDDTNEFDTDVSTPKSSSSPRFKGLRELMQTPRVCDSPVLSGVKELLHTPNVSEPEAQVIVNQQPTNEEDQSELVLNQSLSEETSKEYKGIKELMQTPKGCSTPRFKGMRELMKTPKVKSTPLLDGIKEIMNTPQPGESNLDKFLKTPTAKNIMIPTLPSSAIIEKREDSVEMVHSIEYDLNDTHGGEDTGSGNLGALFKTPVASRFADRLSLSYAEDDNADVAESSSSVSEKNISPTNSKNVTASLLTPPSRSICNRKSLHLKTPLAESPFSAADVLTDLSTSEIENLVDKIDPLEQTITEDDITVNNKIDQEESSGVTLLNNSTADDDSLSVVPETCTKVQLGNSSETMIDISTTHNISSKDPLEKSVVKSIEKNQRPITPLDAADISGIDLLDETAESILETSLTAGDNQYEENIESANLTISEHHEDACVEEAVNDLSEPLLLSDEEENEVAICAKQGSDKESTIVIQEYQNKPQPSAYQNTESEIILLDDSTIEEKLEAEAASIHKKMLVPSVPDKTVTSCIGTDVEKSSSSKECDDIFMDDSLVEISETVKDEDKTESLEMKTKNAVAGTDMGKVSECFESVVTDQRNVSFTSQEQASEHETKSSSEVICLDETSDESVAMVDNAEHADEEVKDVISLNKSTGSDNDQTKVIQACEEKHEEIAENDNKGNVGDISMGKVPESANEDDVDIKSVPITAHTSQTTCLEEISTETGVRNTEGDVETKRIAQSCEGTSELQTKGDEPVISLDDDEPSYGVCQSPVITELDDNTKEELAKNEASTLTVKFTDTKDSESDVSNRVNKQAAEAQDEDTKTSHASQMDKVETENKDTKLSVVSQEEEADDLANEDTIEASLSYKNIASTSESRAEGHNDSSKIIELDSNAKAESISSTKLCPPEESKIRPSLCDENSQEVGTDVIFKQDHLKLQEHTTSFTIEATAQTSIADTDNNLSNVISLEEERVHQMLPEVTEDAEGIETADIASNDVSASQALEVQAKAELNNEVFECQEHTTSVSLADLSSKEDIVTDQSKENAESAAVEAEKLNADNTLEEIISTTPESDLKIPAEAPEVEDVEIETTSSSISVAQISPVKENIFKDQCKQTAASVPKKSDADRTALDETITPISEACINKPVQTIEVKEDRNKDTIASVSTMRITPIDENVIEDETIETAEPAAHVLKKSDDENAIHDVVATSISEPDIKAPTESMELKEVGIKDTTTYNTSATHALADESKIQNVEVEEIERESQSGELENISAGKRFIQSEIFSQQKLQPDKDVVENESMGKDVFPAHQQLAENTHILSDAKVPSKHVASGDNAEIKPEEVVPDAVKTYDIEIKIRDKSKEEDNGANDDVHNRKESSAPINTVKRPRGRKGSQSSECSIKSDLEVGTTRSLKTKQATAAKGAISTLVTVQETGDVVGVIVDNKTLESDKDMRTISPNTDIDGSEPQEAGSRKVQFAENDEVHEIHETHCQIFPATPIKSKPEKVIRRKARIEEKEIISTVQQEKNAEDKTEALPRPEEGKTKAEGTSTQPPGLGARRTRRKPSKTESKRNEGDLVQITTKAGAIPLDKIGETEKTVKPYGDAEVATTLKEIDDISHSSSSKQPIKRNRRVLSKTESSENEDVIKPQDVNTPNEEKIQVSATNVRAVQISQIDPDKNSNISNVINISDVKAAVVTSGHTVKMSEPAKRNRRKPSQIEKNFSEEINADAAAESSAVATEPEETKISLKEDPPGEDVAVTDECVSATDVEKESKVVSSKRPRRKASSDSNHEGNTHSRRPCRQQKRTEDKGLKTIEESEASKKGDSSALEETPKEDNDVPKMPEDSTIKGLTQNTDSNVPMELHDEHGNESACTLKASADSSGARNVFSRIDRSDNIKSIELDEFKETSEEQNNEISKVGEKSKPTEHALIHNEHTSENLVQINDDKTEEPTTQNEVADETAGGSKSEEKVKNANKTEDSKTEKLLTHQTTRRNRRKASQQTEHSSCPIQPRTRHHTAVVEQSEAEAKLEEAIVIAQQGKNNYEANEIKEKLEENEHLETSKHASAVAKRIRRMASQDKTQTESKSKEQHSKKDRNAAAGSEINIVEEKNTDPINDEMQGRSNAELLDNNAKTVENSVTKGHHPSKKPTKRQLATTDSLSEFSASDEPAKRRPKQEETMITDDVNKSDKDEDPGDSSVKAAIEVNANNLEADNSSEGKPIEKPRKGRPKVTKTHSTEDKSEKTIARSRRVPKSAHADKDSEHQSDHNEHEQNLASRLRRGHMTAHEQQNDSTSKGLTENDRDENPSSTSRVESALTEGNHSEGQAINSAKLEDTECHEEKSTESKPEIKLETDKQKPEQNEENKPSSRAKRGRKPAARDLKENKDEKTVTTNSRRRRNAKHFDESHPQDHHTEDENDNNDHGEEHPDDHVMNDEKLSSTNEKDSESHVEQSSEPKQDVISKEEDIKHAEQGEEKKSSTSRSKRTRKPAGGNEEHKDHELKASTNTRRRRNVKDSDETHHTEDEHDKHDNDEKHSEEQVMNDEKLSSEAEEGDKKIDGESNVDCSSACKQDVKLEEDKKHSEHDEAMKSSSRPKRARKPVGVYEEHKDVEEKASTSSRRRHNRKHDEETEMHGHYTEDGNDFDEKSSVKSTKNNKAQEEQELKSHVEESSTRIIKGHQPHHDNEESAHLDDERHEEESKSKIGLDSIMHIETAPTSRSRGTTRRKVDANIISEEISHEAKEPTRKNVRTKKKEQTAHAELTTTPEEHAKSAQTKTNTRTRTQSQSQADHDVDSAKLEELSTTPEDSPSKRGRNVPQRKAATCHLSYDETSDCEKPDKKRKKPESPRKSLEAAKNTHVEAIVVETAVVPSPALSSSAVTARGRTRKPTARVQQFLEEERAKAETPKKRNIDTPTKGKALKRGAKTVDTGTETISASQISKESDNKLDISPTTSKGRKGIRKTKIDVHTISDTQEEPPSKKSPAELEAEKEKVMTPSSDEAATPTRNAARRNAAAAATCRIKDYALETAANEPPKKSRAKKQLVKTMPAAEKRDHRLVSASTVEDDGENTEQIPNVTKEDTKVGTKRGGTRKAISSAPDVTDTAAGEEAVLPVKRSRKAKATAETHNDHDVTDSLAETKSSSAAATTRGGRKNVHFEPADQNQESVTTDAPATTNKRATRARRK